jgi:glucan 1,3-beta-glucosidase
VIGAIASPTNYLKKYHDPVKGGVWIQDCKCVLDPKVNVESLKNESFRDDIMKWLWRFSCPKARGVFTLLGEYAGHTYSCDAFPEKWGVKSPSDFFSDPGLYEDHLKYLSLYLEGVYNTTAIKGPNACDFSGYSVLQCGPERSQFNSSKLAGWADKLGGKPIRGVAAGGLFVLEPWITPNFTDWTLEVSDQYTYSQKNPAGTPGAKKLADLWHGWYTENDFKRMAQWGINSIRLPVGWWYFAPRAGVSPSPYVIPQEDINNLNHPITKFIINAHKYKLPILLDLHGAPGSQNGLDNSGRRSKSFVPERWGYHWFYDPEARQNTTAICVEMVKYIQFLKGNGYDNFLGIELLNEPWVFADMSIVRDWYWDTITKIRQIDEKIPIVLSDAFRHAEWVWLLNDWPFKYTYLDTHIYHAFNPDDIASSTPSCDKLKQTINENIACGYGSMLRFKTCTTLPTMVGEWSLAIDDCMGNLRGSRESVQFLNFGQCNNLKLRPNNTWWTKHVNSFASRQMSMAERELGWFFWTFKTGPGAKMIYLMHIGHLRMLLKLNT